VGASICGSALLIMFLASAAYHIVRVHPTVTRALQRLDHSAIFIAIGGFYTPFCLQGLEGAWSITMLSVIWGLVGAGIIVRQVFHLPAWASGLTYALLGWTALAGAPELAANLGAMVTLKLVFAGLMFTVAAVVFTVRRPDPFPRIFGYHEVFHTLVTLATAAMYQTVLVDIVPR
jgi:hemolysin III